MPFAISRWAGPTARFVQSLNLKQRNNNNFQWFKRHKWYRSDEPYIASLDASTWHTEFMLCGLEGLSHVWEEQVRRGGTCCYGVHFWKHSLCFKISDLRGQSLCSCHPHDLPAQVTFICVAFDPEQEIITASRNKAAKIRNVRTARDVVIDQSKC